jgi:hypothetical protein
MSLANYCSACFNLANELRNSLELQEVEALHHALKGRKVVEWVRWRNSNDSLVYEFVEATPKERTKKVKFREHRLYLTMAAIQHCLEAQAILAVASDPVLLPGGSYRSMAAMAGHAYWKLVDHEIPYWPFPGCESPFVDDPFRDSES